MSFGELSFDEFAVLLQFEFLVFEFEGDLNFAHGLGFFDCFVGCVQLCECRFEGRGVVLWVWVEFLLRRVVFVEFVESAFVS